MKRKKKNVKEKPDAYSLIICSRIEETKEVNKARYKTTKEAAKKVVMIMKNYTYETLYLRLEIKEGEMEIFKVARERARRIRNLSSVR